ncbi:Pre-mRNA-splicing factor 38 [Trinorchestia longiramus]|nr:Pre-mRNA-splicing factor 38 [Trinorchestia longiramus]
MVKAVLNYKTMAYRYENEDPNDLEEEEEEEDASQAKKKSNILPVWGNEKTMNLNTLVLTNIQSSQYFKVKLYALKTYHEVLDEIYYQVSHLEPWEKGSRKTSGQTGMCGGVFFVLSPSFIFIQTYYERITEKLSAFCNNKCLKKDSVFGGGGIFGSWSLGLVECWLEPRCWSLSCTAALLRPSCVVRGVGAGGIVSTAFCILYKLFTLRLTRKQVNGMLNHTDSPYIRGLGFMYLRYTQPPPDLWSWMEPYLEDEETLDVRAGGGQTITIGEMARQMLTKLEWHATLFPRIPVPIQKQIEKQLQARDAQVIQARDAQVIQARDAQVIQACDAQVIQACDAQVIQACDAHVIQVRDAQVIQACHAQVIQACHAQVIQACHAQVIQACHAQVIQARVAQVIQAHDAQAMQASAPQQQNWRNNGIQTIDRSVSAPPLVVSVCSSFGGQCLLLLWWSVSAPPLVPEINVDRSDRRGGSGSTRATPDRGRHSNSRSRLSNSRSRANSHDSGRRDSRPRESDRDRESDRHRDRDGDRHRDADKYRDKDADKYRERDTDRHRDRDVDRQRDRDADRDRNGERDRKRDRERDSERNRDKERDRDRKDRDVDRDRDRGKDKDRDYRKDRDRDNRKDRDRHHDRDRDYHDHRDRHRDGDRERNRSGRSSRERRSRTRSRSRDRYRR